jgi:hypothetical protein
MVEPAAPNAPVNPGDDFEAAKGVVEKLNGLTRERQERVLRWVAETLGITNPSQPKPLATPVPDRPAVPELTHPPAATTRATVDIATFIRNKKPRTGIQFVTAVAHYFKFEATENERRETIDADFAQEATRLADWDRLTDPLSTLNNAVAKGYLNRASPGQFTINTVGENLVARSLPNDDAEPKKRATPSRSSKRKSAKKR